LLSKNVSAAFQFCISITKERTEVIFQGTHATNPNDPHAVWEEYEFKCKPGIDLSRCTCNTSYALRFSGSVNRRPCLISPYHYRLDWLMWFAAFQVLFKKFKILFYKHLIIILQNYRHNPWLIHLSAKFLVNDEEANSLIAHNPFSETDPPR
jgi:hypothetical protein